MSERFLRGQRAGGRGASNLVAATIGAKEENPEARPLEHRRQGPRTGGLCVSLRPEEKRRGEDQKSGRCPLWVAVPLRVHVVWGSRHHRQRPRVTISISVML